MDKVQEIMALVGEYGSMVKCEQFDECDDIYSEIESKLRALLERKPLSDEEIFEILSKGDVAEKILGGGWYVMPHSLSRAIERAHGIGA